MYRRSITSGNVVYSAVGRRLGPRDTWNVMSEDGWTGVRDGTGDGYVSTDYLVRRRERLTLGVSDVEGRILGIGPVDERIALDDVQGRRLAPPTRPRR